MQDVEAIHALVAAHNVGGGVSFGVADVEALAGGIRKHVENVILGLGRIETFVTWTGGAKGLIFGPMGLPFGLELVEGVRLTFLGHDVEGERSGEGWEKHAKNAPREISNWRTTENAEDAEVWEALRLESGELMETQNWMQKYK